MSEDFLPYLDRWGVPRDRVVVIPNWSPIGEVAPRPSGEPVGERRTATPAGASRSTAGRSGASTTPALLWALAERAAQKKRMGGGRRGERGTAPTGSGHRQAAAPNPRLHIHGYQPYADLPDVLGTADILVALLEPDAGVFSVPSKVLTYHCSGRAMVAAVPAQNLSARLIVEAGSGRVVAPGDTAGFVAACEGSCSRTRPRLGRMGANARLYAERTFPIEADRRALRRRDRPVAGRGGDPVTALGAGRQGTWRARMRAVVLTTLAVAVFAGDGRRGGAPAAAGRGLRPGRGLGARARAARDALRRRLPRDGDPV